MHNSMGIVIKNYAPAKQKMVLFDKHIGICWAVMMPSTKYFSSGALISYAHEIKNSFSFLSSTEIINLPFFCAQEDILFLHHVLELCLLFVPAGQPLPELFVLLEFLYMNKSINSLSKKIFLCKFFILLGFYPEGDVKQQSFVSGLAKLSIDTACKQVIDLEKQRDIDQWLERCIQHHAAYKQMKTMHFLKVSKNR